MVKVRAPMLSMEASGSIGGALVFSSWKGTAYVRSLVKPVNPKSAAQLGVRAMLKFLAQIWATVTAPDKATWDTAAENANISPFNAFVRDGMQRWRNGQYPSAASPAVGATTAITTTQTLTGGQRNIVITNEPSADDSNWGIIIYRSTAAIVTPNWNNCIAVVPANGTNEVRYTDAPLVAATYHYRSAVLKDDGSIGTACADASAAAT